MEAAQQEARLEGTPTSGGQDEPVASRPANQATDNQDQDSSSTASCCKPSTRRRRLAHRRQYAKSRRIASSFLRSQFVHYDSLTNKLEEDNWYRVKTFDNSQPSADYESSSAGQRSRVKLSELGQQQPRRQQRLHSATCSGLSHSNRFDISDNNDNNNLQGLVLSPRTPNSASCENYNNNKQEEADEFYVDYSSGSLESCSFLDLNQQQLEASSSKSHLKSPRPLTSSATNAKSLSYLPNFDNYESRSKPGPAGLKSLRKQQLHASTEVHGPSQARESVERVVRSETIDLNREIKSGSQLFSPRSKFFPARRHNEKQQRPQPQVSCSPRGPFVGERFVSLHNLAYSSSDSSQSQAVKAVNVSAKQHPQDCIDNVHFNDLFHGSVNDSSSLTINQSVRTDPRLYKDDVDIKFSRALNSCKLPQIRYASKERLFERLTDLRFLSIDFLNTFLLTYRVFTTAEEVLEALKSVHYNCDRYFSQQQQQQQRDSVCAYSDSNVNMNSANFEQQHQFARRNQEELLETIGNRKSPSQSFGTSAQQHQSENAPLQQKPSVPPRASGTLVASSSNQLPEGGGAPAATAAESTGSKFLQTPNPSQHHKRRSTISALTPITGSSSSSLVNLQTISSANKNAAPPDSQQQEEALAKKRLCSQPEVDFQSMNLSNSDDLTTLMLRSDDATDEPELQVDQVNFADRTRSSSMTPTSGTNLLQLQSHLSRPSQINLIVPGGREVRANSLSHVSDAKNVAQSVRSRTLLSTTMTQATSGNEHWRLSYKKTTSTSNINKPPPTQSSQFLSATYGKGQQPTRRASSSDVNVTFHVTLEPPPAESVTTTSVASQLSELALSNCNTPTFHQSTSSFCPTVPPSTPIEPNQPAPVSSENVNNQLTVKADKKHRKHSSSSKRLPESTSGSSSFLPSGAGSSSSSPVNSASTKSVLTSQSESGLINSNSSLDTSSSSANNAKECATPNGLEDLPSSRKIKLDDEAINRNGRRRSSKINGKVKSFALKEIDYNESKVLDTSAESSSEEDDEDEEDEEEEDDDDEEEGPEFEDKSFKILTKLNSVKLTDSDSADSDETSTGDGQKEKRKNKFESKKFAGSTKREVKMNKGFVEPEVNCSASGAGLPTMKQAELAQQQSAGMRQSVPSRPLTAQQVAPPTNNPGSNAQSIGSTAPSRINTPRSSFQFHPADNSSGDKISKAGVIISSTSPRITSRRSSTASAASAFAAATAAANNPILTHPPIASGVTGNKQPVLLSHSQQLILNQTGELAALNQRFQATGQLSENISHNNLSDSSPCLCQNHRRSSFTINPSSHQQKQHQGRPSLQQHYPSCVHFQQLPTGSPSHTPLNSYPALHSEASSLCNSRASSRLSSCAGLEYSSYSSGPMNFYASSQHQQFVGLSQSQQHQNQQQQQQLKGSLASNQSRQNLANQFPQAVSGGQRTNRNSSQINVRSVATIRVLSVLRHWVSKHSQDFVNDAKLFHLVHEFLQDLIMDTNLLPAEHKAAMQLQQMVQKAAHSRGNQVDLDLLLAPPLKPSPDSIETLSALEVAEGMTFLDHKIFASIKMSEFLGQAWMKLDKAVRAPHILLITKRFNDVSRLVSSEIVRLPELHRRVAVIEKWANVGHINRIVHNYNGVLQICAAFTNSAVFRLKKTWDKVPKTTKNTIEQLQNLVSTDSRFRNMRDAINRCDLPAVPYVGCYLADLSFIEECTPTFTSDNLINFSKLRMIAHVIREIQHFQSGNYKIELNRRVTDYLLDESRHFTDDEMYQRSLEIEPRNRNANGVANK